VFQTKPEAVMQALRDRLARWRREQTRRPLAAELDEIARHCAKLPVLDPRTPDEILGYDEHGVTALMSLMPSVDPPKYEASSPRGGISTGCVAQ